ncbi:MAG: N-acetylneuraminate synthase family protein [Deltaproteobacteria bacterium]|nr:N-acetylneuraminate synthase family protein [Deltaproteobacteria bacterium]MBW2119201.1 N-acetylneuraminate synthase family protein [Deltaproteobacteria bacterium]MBW2342558.1 N-acetylneuraminate synthase family protein [Deltaproteobacteria bacterium]
MVAEIGQAHDGSLGTAHSYIDAVADAGADAVKFQTHIANEESTLDEPFRVKFSFQDNTRYDYWKRMEFTEDQWKDLSKHAKDRNLIFLSSPFSVKAVNILRDIGMQAWKIGSGEVKSDDILGAMAENGAPIILSTGMSGFDEIEDCVKRIRERGLQFALLQCTSSYPTALDQVGLNVIGELRSRFNCPIGLSDHSGTLFPGLAAMVKGIDILEVHVIFDRGSFGPDVPASITVDDLVVLVNARDAFHVMAVNPVDKDEMAENMSQMKSMFSKSVAPAMAMPAGTILQFEMLTLKKPGTGIPASDMENIIGRRLIRDVDPRKLLIWEDLE